MTNLKTTKRALFTSIISLLTCVVMLIGTTFAWFTDTASANVSKIKSGVLDVELLMEDESGWNTAEGKTFSFQVADDATTNKDEDGIILWEPGATFEIPKLKIVNNGNLALKYKLLVTGVKGANDGDIELAKVIDVYINKEHIGTLHELMTNVDGIVYGNLVKKQETPEYKLSFKMHETAGNDYQGKSIENIAFTVVATQDTVETDGSNNQYDKDAVYPLNPFISTGDVQAAIAEGRYVILSSDVKVDKDEVASSGYGKTGISQTNNGVIDGNGKTLSVEGANSTWDSAIYTNGGTIKNLTIDSGFRGIFYNGKEDLFVDNVIIDGSVYTFNSDGGSGKVAFTNSTLNGWTSYAGTVKEVDFTNCNFGEGRGYKFMRPYTKTTLTNCNFSDGYELDTTSTTKEITLTDCKLNGVLITESNVGKLIIGNNVIIKNSK